MEVWVIESGEYEQRGVNGVAVSVAAAVEWLKALYPPPYVVTWGEPAQDEYYLPKFVIFRITGHFEAVQGYSVKHSRSARKRLEVCVSMASPSVVPSEILFLFSIHDLVRFLAHGYCFP